jgi:Uma2 family endonuclease
MGKRYELVAGELRVMPPSGWRHGQVVDNVHALLSPFIRAHQLGRGFGAETGFRIARNPDTVRAPDFAFISNKHLPEENPTEAFWPGAHDLAIEVLSPDDRTREVDEKIEAWLAAGSQAVWVIDPELETVTVYRSRTDVVVNTAADTLAGDPIVPGFSCAVAEIFR